MTLSQKQKRERRKFRVFRARNNIHRCQKCGKELDYERHHLLCNACHAWQKTYTNY